VYMFLLLRLRQTDTKVKGDNKTKGGSVLLGASSAQL